MLFRRSSKPSLTAPTNGTHTEVAATPGAVAKPAPSLPPVDEAVELEHALDTLAAIFRAFGRHAFDLPDADAKTTADTCERWATHLLLRSPAPFGTFHENRREWVAALHYVQNIRRDEQAYINKSLHDLRQAIWAFVHGLHQTLSGEGDASGKIKVQLQRLQVAASGPSTEELKREAISVAQSIGEVFEERKRKQISQLAVLGERMEALGRALEEARREVALDPLTRLYNRKAFDEELVRAADVSALFGQPACLVLIDIDHFKQINDAFGHPAGDEVIRQLTGVLVRTFRRRDDVVARYGGEEFAVILRDTKLSEAKILGERLLEGTRTMTVDYAGQSPRVTVSIGIADARAGERVEEWLGRADRALYAAKEAGRDQAHVSE